MPNRGSRNESAEDVMDYLERIGLALKTTLDSPDNATVSQIRLTGLGAWLAGFTRTVRAAMMCGAVGGKVDSGSALAAAERQ